MIIARALIIVLLCASSMPAYSQASTIFTHVSLDGRWYTTEQRSPFFYLDNTGIFFPGAKQQSCRRADGQAQQFGIPAYYYGAFYYPVYRVAGFSMRPIPGQPGKRAIMVWTAPGNIICDHEVPSPIPDRLFTHGFENSDVLFANGFEGGRS